ncbi:hypothetical protein CEP54_016182 [Fusarium duplospermum]|uniref:JmjC domain-containing protein n=1 Tax=Fusarium duplospermum TaxID=1325734 RepID=A0A428NH78_9HYPO|nr:hypothetical protein CEP54_016182 [Fusarium duplospermum]
MPETESRSIEQRLGDIESLLRGLPDQIESLLDSRCSDLDTGHGGTQTAHAGERAEHSERHDRIAETIKSFTQTIQATLATLITKINTTQSTPLRTPLPTQKPTQATPSAAVRRAEHLATTISQSTTSGHDISEVRIAPDDMGPGMTSTLEALTTTHGFEQIFRVTPLPIPQIADLSEVFTLDTDADLRENRFVPAGDGAVHVLIADGEPDVAFQWPDFTAVVERPTLEEARQFLEDTIRDPPKTTAHFGGTIQHTLTNPSPLHPGDILASVTELTHANEEYGHIGARSSVTCMHKEDAGFLSCNIVDAGYKIWLLPAIEQNHLFEKAIRDEFGGNTCDQWVRHVSLAVTPTWLDDRGIRYRIVVQGRGQMVVTQPAQYHLVVNYSACIARSINYLPPGQQMATKVGSGIAACDNCGLWPLYALEGHFLQEVEPLDPDYFSIRAEPESSEEDDDLDESRRTPPGMSSALACTKRKAHGDLSYRPPKRTRVAAYDTTPEPPRKAGTCSGKKDDISSEADDEDEDGGSDDDLLPDTEDKLAHALGRLVVAPTAQSDVGVTDDVYRMAAAICSMDALKQFANMLSRVYREMRGDAGRMDTPGVDKVMSACNMTKSALWYHLKVGNQWEHVCGTLGEGLLAFIPDGPQKVNPFNVNMEMYKTLGKKGYERDLARFHALIDCEYIKKILHANT